MMDMTVIMIINDMTGHTDIMNMRPDLHDGPD